MFTFSMWVSRQVQVCLGEDEATQGPQGNSTAPVIPIHAFFVPIYLL